MGGLFERVRSARVGEIDPHQQFGCVQSRGHHARYVVASEAVVHLEHRSAQAASVHRADRDLAVEKPRGCEIIEMSGVPSTPSTPGRDRAVASRSRRSYRLRHRHRVRPTARAPRAGWSAATMKSRSSPWTRERRCGSRKLPRCGRAREAGAAEVDRIASADTRVRRSVTVRPLEDRFDLGGRGHRGGALARVATMAPAMLAKRRMRSSDHPCSSP